jgi:hypothetical protein
LLELDLLGLLFELDVVLLEPVELDDLVGISTLPSGALNC